LRSQVPVDGVAKMNSTPAGKSSVIVTLVAGSGPSFRTSIVYVRAAPDITGSALSDFATDRSADGSVL
jgi:hypothetical protein